MTHLFKRFFTQDVQFEYIPLTALAIDDESALDEEKRAPYQFGIGKREPYGFGIGKRTPYEFGVGKREPYGFGIGKRWKDWSLYRNYGQKRQPYNFGVGKRSAEK